MRRCIAAAREAVGRGAYPIAAAVVRAGDVVALEAGRLPRTTDPTAHPELAAVRTACADAGERYLAGAVLVTTVEPCPMCAAAAIWARMDGIVYGVSQPEVVAAARRSGQFTWRQIDLRAETVLAAGEPRLWIAGGVLVEECRSLLELTARRAGGPQPA
jgi:tRNA(Arg) A34 adenosine deaminase TadA